LNLNFIFNGNLLSKLNQFMVIGFTHVGKARTQVIFIFPDERIVAQKVDVVCHEHNVAAPEKRVHSSARV
jgi:hypothetical protein